MKLLKIVFNRFILVSLLIVIQVVLISYLAFILEEKFAVASTIVTVLSIFSLFVIISKQDNPNHKIPWIITILILPPIGLIIYLLFGQNYITKKHRRLYQSENDRQRNYIIQNDKIMTNLSNYDKHITMQSNYIYNTSKCPVYQNSSSIYIKDGKKYFDMLFDDIKNAKEYIFLEYFIISKGQILTELISLLKQKVKEKVDVYLIYDDIGSMKHLPYNFDKVLRREGINCIKFNKYTPFINVFYNNRDHRKIAVIDGKVGYTGGINIADEYANIKTNIGYWKDCGIRITGDAVKSFIMMFIKTYNIYGTKKLDYASYIVENEEQNDGFYQPYFDGPDYIDSYQIAENVYINILSNATKYVYIMSPYLVCDYRIMQAIQNAALRGVDVRLITPGIPDKKIIYTLTRAHYAPLIKAGVKIYEFKKGFVHSKVFISDDKVGVIGTINLDYRSLVHHFENGCLISNDDVLIDIKNDFINTLDECIIPSKKVYSKRNIFYRLYISILEMFAPLM